ncbi:MAG: hypothetical protein LBV23_02350, partial [Deltaproteobacteria bacterium]|nr:hypothetical protein [Deltaproteobacteria bacterium]
KPIERDDTYRNNVAPYRSLVILTSIQVKIYGWCTDLSRNLKRTNVKILRVMLKFNYNLKIVTSPNVGKKDLVNGYGSVRYI